MIKWELTFSVFTICCWCWGKGLNPAGWVAIGGPLAGTEAKFLKDTSCYETFLRSGHNLLAAGPKLRLLARLARLESRSPVTSLLSVEVGVIKVLTPPEPEQSRQYHIHGKYLSTHCCSYSVRRHYQSYYQIQRDWKMTEKKLPQNLKWWSCCQVGTGLDTSCTCRSHKCKWSFAAHWSQPVPCQVWGQCSNHCTQSSVLV